MFFSDEVWAWAVKEEKEDGKEKERGEKGGKKGLKYSLSEYLELWTRAEEVRDGSGGKGVIGAVEVEMVAWVIGTLGG